MTYTIGTVPSSLCDIGTLTFLHITDSASNPLLTRSPMCLTTITDRIIPPNYQDVAICAFIAATNIESIGGFDEWSCTTSGVTNTNPCSLLWSGTNCSASFVVYLDLNYIGLKGRNISFVIKLKYHNVYGACNFGCDYLFIEGYEFIFTLLISLKVRFHLS